LGGKKETAMGQPLKYLSVNGFKSIRTVTDFELKNLNIIVGANGAEKERSAEQLKTAI
jgi:predicted ATPase